jgi:hypothetical protein
MVKIDSLDVSFESKKIRGKEWKRGENKSRDSLVSAAI